MKGLDKILRFSLCGCSTTAPAAAALGTAASPTTWSAFGFSYT